MKHFTITTGVLALLGLSVFSPAPAQGQAKAEPAQGQGQAQPGTPAAPAAPQPSKEELAAYNKFVADSKTSADARQRITTGETFLGAFPNSMYAGAVYAQLAPAYLDVSQPDKMIEAGTKALAADPNNVDILPLMAWAIPRRNGITPQQLDLAMNYARRAINLLATMPKPVEMDDATFAKIKNDKLAQSRSGMGTAYFKTGHYDEAVTELAQAVRLDSSPDPVDYYVLGMSNDRSSHFTAAIDAFNKCAAAPGPLQTNCKNLSAETTKKKGTMLEAQ